MAWSALPLILLILGIETAMHFGGPAIDGPFQMYNALRRIAAGQRGGVDFQFFHGIALPYLHYIPFRLMGGTFAASELARQLVTAVAFPAVLLVFFRIFTRDWRRSFAYSIVVATLAIAFGLWPIVLAVNSLLGVRSALPTLIPAIWILPIRPWVRSVATGTALGMSILLATEQGLAVLAAFLLVSGLLVTDSTDRRSAAVELALSLAVMLMTMVIVTTAVGGVGGFAGAMYYNLKLVPMDQYWYFGGPPNLFLRQWGDIWRLLSDQPTIPVALLFGVLAVAVQLQRRSRSKDAEGRRRAAALMMLGLYGLIASVSLLGIFLVAYVEPGARCVLLIGALELDRVIRARESVAADSPRGRRIPYLAIAAGTSVLLAVATDVWTHVRVGVPSLFATVVERIPHVLVDHVVHGEGIEMQSLWPSTIVEGQKIFDAHRGPRGELPTVWSTYAGILEARNGIFHPSADYIIHVLGPKARAAYVDQFRAARPTLVQTVMPVYTPYEAWIEATSWDFYAEILRNYRVAGATPWSVFWERLPAPNPAPKEFWSAALPARATSVVIPTPPPAAGRPTGLLMQVELTYQVHNPLGKLPVIGALPRYLVSPSGSVSSLTVTLDPYTTTTRFPILALEGRPVTLSFETASLLPGARFDVSRISVATIPVGSGNVQWMINLAQAASRGPIPDNK